MEKLNLKDEIEVLKAQIEEMKRQCSCDTNSKSKAKKRPRKEVLQDCIRELQQISN